MLDLDYDQVGSLLSELSQPAPVPRLDGGLKPPHPFDTEDVSFEDSGSLFRVVDVAIWLNLDATFADNDAPEDIALRLFDELAPGNASANFKVADGVVQLTEPGSQVLEFLLSRASARRAMFQGLIEEERSVASATEAWLEAWDEQATDEPLSINASVDKWRSRGRNPAD